MIKRIPAKLEVKIDFKKSIDEAREMLKKGHSFNDIIQKTRLTLSEIENLLRYNRRY